MQFTARLDSNPDLGFTTQVSRKRGGPPVAMTDTLVTLVLSNGDTMSTTLPTDPDLAQKVLADFKFDAHIHWGLEITEVRP